MNTTSTQHNTARAAAIRKHITKEEGRIRRFEFNKTDPNDNRQSGLSSLITKEEELKSEQTAEPHPS